MWWFSRPHISRAAVVSSATAVATLTRYVSNLLNFAPTKCAAEVVLKMLRAVDANDDSRILLIKRVVDVLLLIREYFDETGVEMPPALCEKMQEFEIVLQNIYEKLIPVGKKSFFRRAMSKDKIKSDLAAHSASLDAAIWKLNLSLLLRVTVATQTTVAVKNQQVECTTTTTQTTALVCAPQRDPDEEFLDQVTTLYDEVRISDIRLVPPEDDTERAFATFTDCNYALVKGEKRLIKSFDGDDEQERKNWVKEVKHWHRLKHPNVLQLQGITNRSSPHLYVIFQNGQARCLATYLAQALNSQDVPSVATMIVKMMNSAVSAIKHVRNKLRVDEATSVLAAEDATFALDTGGNLVLSINPIRRRNNKKKKQVALRHTLEEMFWPPMESRNVPRYLRRLKATQDSPGIFSIKMSDIRTAVNAFLVDHVCLDENKGEHFISPKLKPGWTDQPIFSASIDCGNAVKAGDYGVLVPGMEEDYAFRSDGNACEDCPGIVSCVTETKLPDYTSDGLAEIVQESPRVWRSDLNETKRKGFSNLKVNWYHLQNLADIGQAGRFLVNSVPLLHLDKPYEELILITKVTHVKEYRFLVNEGKAVDDASRPLPFVYATEPECPEDELQFSQYPPKARFRDLNAASSEVWDSRVIRRGKERELKRIRYIQLRREDIVKRFGFVPMVGGARGYCNAGPIIRNDRRWNNICREYELLVRRSEPWCRVKPSWKESP